MRGRYVENTDFPQGDLLAGKVDVDLDMLGATMMDRVGGHIDRAGIVAVDNGRNSNRDVKLVEKLAQLTTLGDDVGDGSVLRFSTGAGDCGLALGGPRHQVIAEEEAEA
jgi:hypothetical protein